LKPDLLSELVLSELVLSELVFIASPYRLQLRLVYPGSKAHPSSSLAYQRSLGCSKIKQLSES